MNEYLYHVLYTVEPKPQGIPRSEIPSNNGACNAIVVLSILYPPDGSYSLLAQSLDGQTKEPLSSKEVFKAWLLMAAQLAETVDLDEARRSFALGTFEAFLDAVNPEPERVQGETVERGPR